MKPTGKYETEWGIELLWANNDEYSGKLIIFPDAGKKMPMSLHQNKSKTWFINGGKLRISYVDNETKEVKTAELAEGGTCHFSKMSAHEVEVLEPAVVFEVANTDHHDDTHPLRLTSEEPPSEQ